MKKCVAFIFLLSALSYGQAPDTTVTIHGKGTVGPYLLGFQNLISGSLSISKDSRPLSDDSFSVQYAEGILDLTAPLPIGDSLIANFSFLPLSLRQRYFLHDMIFSSNDTTIADPPPIYTEKSQSDLNIIGSKGFSFQAGQGVDNSLSQSLNLSITA